MMRILALLAVITIVGCSSTREDPYLLAFDENATLGRESYRLWITPSLHFQPVMLRLDVRSNGTAEIEVKVLEPTKDYRLGRLKLRKRIPLSNNGVRELRLAAAKTKILDVSEHPNLPKEVKWIDGIGYCLEISTQEGTKRISRNSPGPLDKDIAEQVKKLYPDCDVSRYNDECERFSIFLNEMMRLSGHDMFEWQDIADKTEIQQISPSPSGAD